MMFGVHDSVPSKRKKSNAASRLPQKHVFTFKEARQVSRNDRKAGGKARTGGTERRVNKNTSGTVELETFLNRLGVDENERKRYVSMCEACDIGKQELNRCSSNTLFGVDGGEKANRTNDAEDSYHRHHDDDGGGGGGGGGHRVGFLKRIVEDAAHPDNPSKKTTTNNNNALVLGSRRVSFISITVTASNPSSTNPAKVRRPGAICLCLPPTVGRTHGTSTRAQEQLADLMIMKLFFVVRFIYRTFQDVTAAKRRMPRDSGDTAMYDHDHYCLPAIVVQGVPQSESPGATWYTLMKAKIRRGEDEYAKCLSLKYFCNLL